MLLFHSLVIHTDKLSECKLFLRLAYFPVTAPIRSLHSFENGTFLCELQLIHSRSIHDDKSLHPYTLTPRKMFLDESKPAA